MTSPIPDYHEIWQAALEDTDASYGERRLFDAAERAFWKRFIAGRPDYRPDPEASVILSELKQLLASHRRDTALEIGPGWGNYTVELARWFQSLTCVDLSPDVLDYIRQLAVSENCGPIQTVCSSWEQYESATVVNVVLGYNCFYRIQDLEADVCIIRFDEDVSYQTWQELQLGETAQLADPAAALQKHRLEIERILRSYFVEQPDGSYRGTHACRGSLMSWTPIDFRPRNDIHLMRT